METRALGRTGLEVLALGYGCGAIGGLMVRSNPRGAGAQRRASAGRGHQVLRHCPVPWDGASEQNLGHALGDLGVRPQVRVGTKVRLGPDQLAALVPLVRRSLKHLARLTLDRIDVVHLRNPIGVETPNPSGSGLPIEVALEQVAEGLTRLVEDGLTRHIGFTAVGNAEALKRVAAAPAYETAQAYLNVLKPSGIRPSRIRVELEQPHDPPAAAT